MQHDYHCWAREQCIFSEWAMDTGFSFFLLG